MNNYFIPIIASTFLYCNNHAKEQYLYRVSPLTIHYKLVSYDIFDKIADFLRENTLLLGKEG